MNIISEKREPFFLHCVQEKKPDMVILDFRHAQFVANKLNQSFVDIDKD
jgi:hypothetical protein